MHPIISGLYNGLEKCWHYRDVNKPKFSLLKRVRAKNFRAVSSRAIFEGPIFRACSSNARTCIRSLTTLVLLTSLNFYSSSEFEPKFFERFRAEPFLSGQFFEHARAMLQPTTPSWHPISIN